MIEELHIRGLGVIEDSTLRLGPGLTVITGETGAGKTMLVTALQLLLGARASTDLVRQGTEAALVEAVVRVPEPLPAPPSDTAEEDAGMLRELWGLAEDGAIIVSREIPAEGRNRARVGGRLVPTATLAALLGPLIDIHGQHEHVRLEQPAVQRRLLDAYGGPEHAAVLATHRAAHAAWAEAARRVRLVRDGVEARRARLAMLVAEREAIDAVRPDAEQDATLDQDIERLANADGLREALTGAHAAAGPSGALDALGAAVAALRRAPVDDPVLVELGERLRGISRDLSEVVAELAALRDDIEADDARLDALQGRKRALMPLLRRFGPGIGELLAHREAVASEIAELEGLEADASGVDAALDEAHRTLVASGSALTAARNAIGERLAGSVAAHLAELGLAHARLQVGLRPLDAPTADGADRVELLLAANPGEPAVRLADAASGGERSRVALALEVVLTADRERSVLVFDEVDAGVGGATALAVGEKLARLAHGAAGVPARQVLCVTHLAQVAAHADAHHLVEKRVEDGRTVTRVHPVGESDRAHVLAHMLGGDATAEAGLEHARALLRAARGSADVPAGVGGAA